jgi:hypothetical protein
LSVGHAVGELPISVLTLDAKEGQRLTWLVVDDLRGRNANCWSRLLMESA